MKWVWILLSFAAGAASATQGLYNGYWTQRLDLKTVLLANAAVVFAAALLYYFWERGDAAALWKGAAPSLAVGGLCGTVIVVAFALAFPRLGAFHAIVLFIAGQLAAALLFDAFGLLNLPVVPVSWQRAAGALLVGIGAFLVLP